MRISIIYKKAKPSDQKEIFALEKLVWGSEVANWYDLAMFIRFGFCFVAKRSGQIVGFIHGFTTSDDRIYIMDWVVHKNYQSKGVGKTLYFQLIKATPGQTLISLIDTDNKRSLQAHREMGFKKVRVLSDPYNEKEYNKKVIKRPRRVLVERTNDVTIEQRSDA